jgi:hypothetical protein
VSQFVRATACAARTARIALAFRLDRKSATVLIVELADAMRMGDLDYTAAEREAARVAPRKHRAAEDDAHWATFSADSERPSSFIALQPSVTTAPASWISASLVS